MTYRPRYYLIEIGLGTLWELSTGLRGQKGFKELFSILTLPNTSLFPAPHDNHDIILILLFFPSPRLYPEKILRIYRSAIFNSYCEGLIGTVSGYSLSSSSATHHCHIFHICPLPLSSSCFSSIDPLMYLIDILAKETF